MNLFKIAFVVFSVFLVSCSNDIDTKSLNSLSGNAQTRSNSSLGYTVENGYLSFSSMATYIEIVEMLSDKSKKELLDWSKDQKINSLLKSYDNIDMRIKENQGENEEINPIPFKMVNNTFSSLFNEKGIMLINDTIYKVIDDFVYIIANKDFETLEKLEKSPSSFESLPIVSRYRHTYALELVSTTRSVENGDRSHLIEISSSRREFMEFSVSLSTRQDRGLYLDIKMTGRAQKKGLWWSSPFSDEFDWAQFRCFGGFSNDTVSFPGFVSGKAVNESELNFSYAIGPSFAIEFVRTRIEFSFTKNPIAPNQVYTNEYIRRNNG